MASGSEQAPDLVSILRTLAGFAPQSQQPQYEAQSQTPPYPAHLDQSQTSQSWVPKAEQAVPLPRSTTPDYPPIAPAASKNVVDPATIVEWSAGLRCVMKTVAKHDNMLSDIRKMIKIQHEHEEQWWNGRVALIERQRARKEGQKKLDDVLKAVGGTITGGFNKDSADELVKELETFDMKVYKAQTQMVKEMTNRLRSLGVPFFGTRSELVRANGKEAPAIHDAERAKSMIDELELMKLQRKMLVILEDLCSD